MSCKSMSTISNPGNGHADYLIINDRIDHAAVDSANGTPLTGDSKPTSKDDEEFQLKRPTTLQIIFSWRSVIIALLHVTYIFCMLPVASLSMALVCMCGPVGRHQNRTLSNTSHFFNTSMYEDYTVQENSTSVQEKQYEFNWDSKSQGLLISSHLFLAFLVPQLANFIRRYLGSKWTLMIFSLAMAFLNFIGPAAARTGVHFLLAVRILLGLCINANIPISGDMMAWWLPAREKLVSASIVVSGWMVAGSLGPLLSGYFCRVPIDNGWPLIFYFNGAVIVVWSIGWYFLASHKPETHPFISEQEKRYILTHRLGMDHAGTKAAEKTPYRTILTSRPCLAFVIYGMFYLWAMLIAFTCLPLYLTSVLGFSLVDTGILLAVLASLRLPAMLLWSLLGNWLLTLRSMTVNRVRKTMVALSTAIASSLFLVISFLDAEHRWVAVVLVVMSVAAASCGTILSSVIPLDMAPRYSGFISGLYSSLTCLASLTSPMFVTAITAKGLYTEWRSVWITMAAVKLTSGLIFLIFGNASLQPWAVSEPNTSASKILVVPPPDRTQKDVSEALSFQPLET